MYLIGLFYTIFCDLSIVGTTFCPDSARRGAVNEFPEHGDCRTGQQPASWHAGRRAVGFADLLPGTDQLLQQPAQGVLFLLRQSGKQVFLAVAAVVQRVAAAEQQPFQAVRRRHRAAVTAVRAMTVAVVVAVFLPGGGGLSGGQTLGVLSTATAAGGAQRTATGAAGAGVVGMQYIIVHNNTLFCWNSLAIRIVYPKVRDLPRAFSWVFPLSAR